MSSVRSSRLCCRRVTPQSHISLGGRKVRVPSWFHGLLDRRVAEDLLMKSPVHPKEGLFLVRQSSNRGGCFVISVCTGHYVNHYLIETLESMFYVKRENGDERGRDIQACDLIKLVECYKRLPLDVSGLTLHQPLPRTTPVAITTSLSPTPSSKDNHNYIPLYVDHRYYVGKEEYHTQDLESVSFGNGEPITILLKETKHWWFGFNSKGDLGYFPSALLLPLYDVDPEEMCGRLSEDERVELSEFAKYSDEDRGRGMDFKVHQSQLVLDSNSNHVLTKPQREQINQEEQRLCDGSKHEGSRQIQRVNLCEMGKSAKDSKQCQNEIYVSSEYIKACLQNHERKLMDNLLQAHRSETRFGLSSTLEESHAHRNCMQTEDMEWVFAENMDVALLEPEQIVPDIDGEFSSKLGQINHVEGLEDELWMGKSEASWNSSAASNVSVKTRTERMLPNGEGLRKEGFRDIMKKGFIEQSVTEMEEDLRGAIEISFSPEYDPVATYLRLCDCSSRPATSS